MRKLAKIVLLLFCIVVLAGCCTEEQNVYKDGQSDTVVLLRKNGYHEYSSKLNDIVYAELNSLESDVISAKTIETIAVVSEKLAQQKNHPGCYVIAWENSKEQMSDTTIILEWNEKDGVIIRIFTLSEKIKHLLPLQSY